MNGLETVFESEHSSQVILGIAKKGKKVLLDRPVPARNVRNFRLTSRWTKKENEEIPFSVIGIQGSPKLLIIGGRRNLDGTLFAVENTDGELSASQYNENRFFAY